MQFFFPSTIYRQDAEELTALGHYETTMEPTVHPAFASSAEESDEDLFVRFIRGGPSSDLETLIARHHSFAYRVAIAVCGDDAVAQDAVQETCLLMLNKTVSFEPRGKGSFKAWLYETIKRTTKTRSRSEMRKKQMAKHPHYLSHARDSAERQIAAAGAGEEESSKVRKEVERALTGLGEDLRLPVVLHFLEGLSQVEIAPLIGVSPSQVSRRISQGLKELRSRMAAAGVSISAAVLPGLLTSSELLKAPALTANFAQWAAQAALKEGARASVRYASRKSLAALWLTLAACAMAVGGIAWWNLSTQSKQSDAPKEVAPLPSGPVPAAKPAPQNEPPALRSYVWNFRPVPENDHPSKSFEVIEGSWQWTNHKNVQSGMALQPGALVKIPVEMGDKPFRAKLDIPTILTGSAVEWGVYWADSKGRMPRKTWKKNVTGLQPSITIVIYFYDLWSVGLCNGRVAFVSQYERKEGTIAFAVTGLVAQINIDELDSDGIPEEFRNPQALIPKHQLKPGYP